jgi:hypothetical protein
MSDYAMRNALVLSIGLASLSAACGDEAQVSRSIAAAVAAGPGTPVILGEHAPFTWHKVCLLGPYTAASDVDRLVGVQGAAHSAHGIQTSDSINVLMFVADGRIAASVAHPRTAGDFAREVVGACYTRAEATFSVRVPPPGEWGNIGSREPRP